MNKAKIKGTYWENKCARELNRSFRKSGFEFRRTLLSGSAGDKYKEHAGDIQVMDSLHGTWCENQVVIECKLRSSLKTGCLHVGNSIIDNFIKKLFFENSAWVLLIKTGKDISKSVNTKCEEWILLPAYGVGKEGWYLYPNRLRFNEGKNYAFMELRSFLKIKDGYKYFLQ